MFNLSEEKINLISMINNKLVPLGALPTGAGTSPARG